MVRYLHPADYQPAIIRQADKDFARELDFKDTKIPVKIRDIHKIEKKTVLSTLVFLVTKTRANIQYMCQ